MTIQWPEWLISSYQYGYILKHKKTSSARWKTYGYYETLHEAIVNLGGIRIRLETEQLIIDATNSASARLNTLELVKKIDTISSELSEGVSHA